MAPPGSRARSNTSLAQSAVHEAPEHPVSSIGSAGEFKMESAIIELFGGSDWDRAFDPSPAEYGQVLKSGK